MVKKIGFLTGTRADYGKIKSLLDQIVLHNSEFELHVLVTGMHLEAKYGSTVNQILADYLGNIHFIPNQAGRFSMELTLARTIEQLSSFLDVIELDLLVVHGDRVEALAGAITCSLKNIPVGHIEGGELSGTIDGIIRHAISKLVNIHFVANSSAKKRLIQLGENLNSIYVIGSPDIDALLSENLPTIQDTKLRYGIPFKNYSIFIFHPVTNEIELLQSQITNVCDALIQSNRNYIVISPNNDLGTEIIQRTLERKLLGFKYKHFPSMRFESFLTILKFSDFIIGNSSAGIREAGYYGVPCINIGTRQKSRHRSDLIINTSAEIIPILEAIEISKTIKRIPEYKFGKGDSAMEFIKILTSNDFWPIKLEKDFVDIFMRTNGDIND